MNLHLLTPEEISAIQSVLSIVRQGGDARLVARSKEAASVSKKLYEHRKMLANRPIEQALTEN